MLGSQPALAQTQPTPLVATNSAWKYLDDGSDQGTAWRMATFSDAGWAAGNAELGYGDNDEATKVSFGPSSSAKYATTYFRQKFTVSGTDFAALKLRLLRDDGAVVYLNGVEVFRSNMPTGDITYGTYASSTVDGENERTFVETVLPKTAVLMGENIIAVEIHQDRPSSSDISFNLELLPEQQATPVACAPLPASFLSSFVSVQPSAQAPTLIIPSTHTYQLLVQSEDAYSNPADGTVKAANDFTGYVPIGGSSTRGYLSINHERSSADASGVSILDLQFDAGKKLWEVTAKNPVNFGPVVGTYNNCSGGITPWNTVVTCEENTPTAPTDSNGDGYLDYGWNVELDPATRTVKDQNGDGTPDKLWHMGRMRHENVVLTADGKIVYEGADEGSNSFVYKYLPTTPGQLGNGALYVLKLDGEIGTATTGTWIQVPNSTPTECNNTVTLAKALGATNFAGVEDVEIGPHDGLIYFTSKGSGRVYRFQDAPAAVSGFEIFVGNPVGVTDQSYAINYGTGTVLEAWGTGNDNLTFDSKGNLYVLQDGGRDHIWLVKPCHTQASPAVEIFAVTPAGSEPTGMTLSPDEKFMFVSMQGPNATNTLATVDAAGQQVVFNKSSTLVIARREDLGGSAVTAAKTAKNAAGLSVYPNPVADVLHLTLDHPRSEKAVLQVVSTLGGNTLTERSVSLTSGPNDLTLPVQHLPGGHYILLIKTAKNTLTRQFIKQ